MNTLAQRIKEAREAREWSQRDMAREMGVSQQTIAHWEAGGIPRGKRHETLRTLLGAGLFSQEKAMLKVYLVNEVHMCDDPYYQGPPSTVALYTHEQDALAAVAEYEQECKRQYEQEQDANTETLGDRVYRSMDLQLVSSEMVGDTLVDKYKYVPKTEYDYADLWDRFPQRWVSEMDINQGESK